ncbi:methionine aminopeptidase [Lachnospiraceae bacterium KM106-2]|nr:methionine aminopeptidase [Lachnospiraceae bacterium KM106-2]
MIIGRNDPCWCGSQVKYKNCHLQLDEKIKEYADRGAMVPNHDMIKNQEEIEGIRKASEINTMVLDKVSEYVKPGVSTEELNKIIHEYTLELGAIPATLGYEGYPKSVCISINEVVCHGIPSEKTILKDGDIVNIDCTTIYNTYFGDASRMYCVGNVSEEKRKLVQVTKECLDLGLAEVKPFKFLGDIGYVINKHAKENGYTVVREIGGHGVGLEMHEEPWVSHIGQRNTDILLVPGMIFTIEPMVNMGTADVYQDDSDGWTIYTEDGKPSAQWEYTILVTEDGAEVLSH